MSGRKLALDTNIILYLLAGDQTLADFLDGKQGYLSVITELELIGYPDISEVESDKVKAFLSGCTIVDISSEVKEIYIRLRRHYRMKPGDAAAAATAIYMGLPFMTADKDFNKITELELMLYTP